MCLMRLVARWLADCRGQPAPRVEIATVDHGLRAKSADEARWAGEQAKLLGFTHSTLVWSGDKPPPASRMPLAKRAMRCSALMRTVTARPPS